MKSRGLLQRGQGYKIAEKGVKNMAPYEIPVEKKKGILKALRLGPYNGRTTGGNKKDEVRKGSRPG